MLIKSILLAFPLMAGLCTFAFAADVNLKRVWPVYRTAESFTTIAEYFGREAEGGKTPALRTQPDHREGYYWLTRVNTDIAYPGSVIQLQVTRQSSTDPATHTFDWDVPSGSNAIFLGLTGSDWTDPLETPIAWRLTLMDANGDILTSAHSFLWNESSP
ncbi:MAG: hypothetical protein ACN6I3_00155 [bacterium]